MRIAILGTRGIPSGYSGYETFAEELGTRLVERGHQVTIYAHANLFPQKPPLYRGVRLIYLPTLKGKNTSQFTHSVLSTLHVIFSNTDVVLFCNAANGPFGLVLRLARKKSVINVDGLEWLRPKWSALAKKYFRFGARCSVLFFDRVVTDAKGMADVYVKEFGCDSVCIAYGATPKYSENPKVLEQFNLLPNQYYLIASRLVPDNNAHLIVKAFVQTKTRRKLAIAGGTLYRNAYEEELKKIKDDRIVFLGHIDDAGVVEELHTNAYAYLHGHEFGGTNPALLKALACGNCVLALDTVFNREVLDQGEYGILYPKDASVLARLIDEVDADQEKADSFRRKARNRILEKYTWEKITDEYEALFRSIIGA